MRQFSAHRRIGLSFRMFELIWFNLGDRFRPIGKHSIGMEAINHGAPYVLGRTHKLRAAALSTVSTSSGRQRTFSKSEYRSALMVISLGLI